MLAPHDVGLTKLCLRFQLANRSGDDGPPAYIPASLRSWQCGSQSNYIIVLLDFSGGNFF